MDGQNQDERLKNSRICSLNHVQKAAIHYALSLRRESDAILRTIKHDVLLQCGYDENGADFHVLDVDEGIGQIIEIKHAHQGQEERTT